MSGVQNRGTDRPRADARHVLVGGEYMSRIGAGTAMGTYVRRFWTPLMLSSDLPEPDGDASGSAPVW